MNVPALSLLKFRPIYKDKIWGGQKIRTYLGKDFGNLANCGESWEISGVDGDLTAVVEGPLAGQTLPELIETYGRDLLGNKVYDQFGNQFPLLIKFIDANDDLSIQVHPDDKVSNERHQSFGKTEMWYIIQSDPGSKLTTGFSKKVSKEEFKEYSKSSEVLDVLNEEEALPGDVFFLPAGRVHSIGKGLLLAEIQQTSDVTYRVYDFDRTDNEGNKRELHIDQSLDVIDYEIHEDYKTGYDRKSSNAQLVECQYFRTNKLHLKETQNKDYSSIDSFVVYICLKGGGSISAGDNYSIKAGESLLLPASINKVALNPDGEMELLETYVP